MADHSTIFDCCRRNDAKTLKIIIRSGGANLNAKNGYGSTPLHVAAFHNSKECLLLLLEYKAEINAGNTYGDTPLHIAAGFNSKECLQLLLETGADPDIKNGNGHTPLDLIQDADLRKEIEEYANMISTLNIKEPGR